jgi:electron transfer flavoprotein alpha subunit
MSDLPAGRPLALAICRHGVLPRGALDAHVEAGGASLVIGTGAKEAAASLPRPGQAWWWETSDALLPLWLAPTLAPVLNPVGPVILPDSPDGRDLAPHLAVAMDRSLLSGALSVDTDSAEERVETTLLRLDGRVLVPVFTPPAVVVTLTVLGRPAVATTAIDPGSVFALRPPAPAPEPEPAGPGVEVLAEMEAAPRTMALQDATRILCAGAGLAGSSHGDDNQARSRFDLLVAVAAALGGSAGATRVVTDGGGADPDRQIGTTGAAIDPDLYMAFGVSGAAQHLGGVGAPMHVVSINTDPFSPMTAFSDLGIVADAPAVLAELADRLGVDQLDVDRASDRTGSVRPG